MSAIVRWCFAPARGAMIKNRDGEWVRASDLAPLLAELEAVKQAAAQTAGLCVRERGEALAEVGKLKSDLADYMQAANYEATRAERLSEAGRRVTAAFRAHGESVPFTREADRTRHECEAAMIALDAALEQEKGRD